MMEDFEEPGWKNKIFKKPAVPIKKSSEGKMRSSVSSFRQHEARNETPCVDPAGDVQKSDNEMTQVENQSYDDLMSQYSELKTAVDQFFERIGNNDSEDIEAINQLDAINGRGKEIQQKLSAERDMWIRKLNELLSGLQHNRKHDQ